MKKLLITGFEPFGGEDINPSWEAVRLLPDEIGDYSLYKLCIPVTFGGGAERLLASAEELHPDVILSIGQAGGRADVTPELVAINLRHASIPDNNGYQPIDLPIIEGGCAAYFSTRPMRQISRAIRDSGIPSHLSYSAGAYVCNDLIYTILARFDGTDTRAGFIHIPYCTLQSKEPAMPLATIVSALVTAIKKLD